MLQSGCSPVPDPFIYTDDFDVGSETVNTQHEMLMQLINLLSNDRTNIGVLDELVDLLKLHFETEEAIMTNLLKQLNEVRAEYEELVQGRQGYEQNGTSTASTFSLASASELAENLEINKSLVSQKPLVAYAQEEKPYDPVYECKIKRWSATGQREFCRVYIMDHVLTEARLREHKVMHSVFLADCAILKRNLLNAFSRAVPVENDGLRGVDNNEVFSDANIGDNEIIFVKNWYCQHVKTEDVRMDHTARLVQRLRNAIDAEKIFTELAKAETEEQPETVSEAESEDSIDSAATSDLSSGSGVTLLARKWLAGLRTLCDVGVLILRPPRKKSRNITIALGSFSWGLLGGYHPWELVKVTFDKLVPDEEITELLLDWQTQLASERPTNEDSEGGSSVVRVISCAHKSGRMIKTLAVFVPVLIASPLLSSRTMYFSVMLFHPRCSHSNVVRDLSRRQYSDNFETAIDENRVRCQLLCRNPGKIVSLGWLINEWKVIPVANDLFNFGIEQIVTAFIRSSPDFSSHLGFSMKLFPCKWFEELLVSRKKLLKATQKARRILMPGMTLDLSAFAQLKPTNEQAPQSLGDSSSLDIIAGAAGPIHAPDAEWNKTEPQKKPDSSDVPRPKGVVLDLPEIVDEESSKSYKTKNPQKQKDEDTTGSDTARQVVGTHAFPEYSTTTPTIASNRALNETSLTIRPKARRQTGAPKNSVEIPSGTDLGYEAKRAQKKKKKKKKKKTPAATSSTPMQMIRRKRD